MFLSLMIDPDNSFPDFSFPADPPDPEFSFGGMEPYLAHTAAMVASASPLTSAMHSSLQHQAPFPAYALVSDPGIQPMPFDAPSASYYLSPMVDHQLSNAHKNHDFPALDLSFQHPMGPMGHIGLLGLLDHMATGPSFSHHAVQAATLNPQMQTQPVQVHNHPALPPHSNRMPDPEPVYGFQPAAAGPQASPRQPTMEYDPNAYFQKLLNAMQRAKSAAATRRSTKKRYRVLRGISAGGSSSKPPKQNHYSAAEFVPVHLNLEGAGLADICHPMWSPGELEDRRRIVRIERTQDGPNLNARFSIVGCANENPVPLAAGPDTDVIEVLCLQCEVMDGADDEDTAGSSISDDNQLPLLALSYSVEGGPFNGFEYYVTSVEVVGIVELLIGTQLAEAQERRKERGRIRSNLVPFWLKKPVSLRITDGRATSVTNKDLRYELAKRIMAYEIRRPRGFDKEVRILRWDKLIPALKRALQSYYVELPADDVPESFIDDK